MKQPFILLIALICLAGAAQIDIAVPVNNNEIPISGQSLAVLVIGFLLGKKWGAICMLLYIIIGGMGLPIFADGGSGFETLIGGSGGYLYGFVFGAVVLGALQENEWGETFQKCIFAMTIGTVIILLFGIMQLSYLYGFEKALEYGLYPFIPGAVVKIVIGAILIYYADKWMRQPKTSFIQ